eukprot:gene7667-7728_t
MRHTWQMDDSFDGNSQSWRARRLIEAFKRRLSLQQGDGVQEVLTCLGEQNLGDVRATRPKTLDVVRFIDETLVETAEFDGEIAASIAALAPDLEWMQSSSYTDEILGEGFTANYGWCEIIGPRGFFKGDDFLLGLLMLGPNRHYLDHHHPAPELYWPLTGGTLWRKGDSDLIERAAGTPIWHPAHVVHATKTLEKPLLTFWSWTRETSVAAKLV